MRKSIVTKLFFLTSGLCILIITGIFLGQTIFFKHFYVQQKVNNVQAALRTITEADWTAAGDAQNAFQLEQQFYEQHSTWVALLDDAGNLIYADDFAMEVQVGRATGASARANQTITIPLYTVTTIEEFETENALMQQSFISPGSSIVIEGLWIDERLFPQRIGRSVANLREENRLENPQLINKEYEVVARFQDNEYEFAPRAPGLTANEAVPRVPGLTAVEIIPRSTGVNAYRELYPSVLVYGTVTQVHKPEGAERSRYANHLFWERVRAFQADLIFGDVEDAAEIVSDYEQNDINYKLFIKRLTDAEGSTKYLFAMTSLQPVNEALGVMRHYYGYVIVGSVLLAVFASFYYARGIARPLLRLNEVTQRMANLDFSARIPVNTHDEIGNLARNINELSDLLHAHIVRLEQDIEHEKRLEQTRKDFIAGVSHELRTPLSVIESCLYMLKKKPDSEKRAHYFSAIQDEVEKMNLLISDMLELAKYESGRYKAEMVPFRIDSLLERVCLRLRSDIAGKGLRLHTEFIPVEVMGNERLIEQVVVNFVTNAIRYTPEKQDVVITTSDEPDRIKVCIENKGVHLPEDQLERVWERFYRGERSRHRSTGGTGLGLAISKHILELHGATYGATNTAEGVMFFFALPKAETVQPMRSAAF